MFLGSSKRIWRDTQTVVPWPEVGEERSSPERAGGLKIFYFYNDMYLFLTCIARHCNFCVSFDFEPDAKEMKIFLQILTFLQLTRALLNLSFAECTITCSKVTHWGVNLFLHLLVFLYRIKGQNIISSFEKIIQMFFETFPFLVWHILLERGYLLYMFKISKVSR